MYIRISLFLFFYPNEVECNSLLELLFPETLLVNGLGVRGRLISHDVQHNRGGCIGTKLEKLVRNGTIAEKDKLLSEAISYLVF